MTLTVIILIVAVCITLFWGIGTGNRFRRLGVKIDESESGIDVALTKRYDTLTKMLEVCRQYAAHETGTFAKVIELRKGMTMQERSEANAQMDFMASRLNAVAENYPQLRSAEVFGGLQDGISDEEAHLQAARRLYNANVSSFNQLLVSFPASVIGNRMKLSSREFFEAEEVKRADVSMKL